jgi:hypothetical protein
MSIIRTSEKLNRRATQNIVVGAKRANALVSKLIFLSEIQKEVNIVRTKNKKRKSA